MLIKAMIVIGEDLVENKLEKKHDWKDKHFNCNTFKAIKVKVTYMTFLKIVNMKLMHSSWNIPSKGSSQFFGWGNIWLDTVN